jgi:hypothetical protein
MTCHINHNAGSAYKILRISPGVIQKQKLGAKYLSTVSSAAQIRAHISRLGNVWPVAAQAIFQRKLSYKQAPKVFCKPDPERIPRFTRTLKGMLVELCVIAQ